MDNPSPSGASAPSRKAKFKPQLRPRKLIKLGADVKSEVSDVVQGVGDDLEWQKLVKVASERKVAAKEKNVPTLQVSFGYNSESTLEKSLGFQGGFSAIRRNDTVIEPKTFEVPMDTSTASDADSENDDESIIPWSYGSHYPITLPLEKPFSRNHEPDGLKSDAFRNLNAEESRMNSVAELGLMEQVEEEQMLLFQFPPSLPYMGRLAATKCREIASHGRQMARVQAKKGCKLEDLLAGYMGKLLIFKSGCVKMKLGDTLFDVSSGLNCTSAQDISLINPSKKQCSVLGSCPKRAVVSLDVDWLLNKS